MNKEFTLSIFTENVIGMLGRICMILTRRHINIESLTTSESEVENIYRYTIVIHASQDQVRKVSEQIEKLVEVFRVYIYEDKDIFFREMALFKVTDFHDSQKIEAICASHKNIRIVEKNEKEIRIEQVDKEIQIEELLTEMKTLGTLQFVRSGRIAIPHSHEHIDTLKELVKE